MLTEQIKAGTWLVVQKTYWYGHYLKSWGHAPIFVYSFNGRPTINHSQFGHYDVSDLHLKDTIFELADWWDCD